MSSERRVTVACKKNWCFLSVTVYTLAARVSAKREASAIFDWLKVNNSRLIVIDTSTIHVFKQKRWREYKQVLVVANSLPTCLPTVYVKFAQSPTRVCELLLVL